MKDIDHIHSSLFELMFLIQIEMKKVIKNADIDLSPMEILLLRTLAEDDEITQQQLGKKLSKDKAQITRLVQQLERKKLITKHQNPHDKRSFLITINHHVKTKVLTFIDYEKEMISRILKGVTANQRKTLGSTLELMKTNIKAF